MTGKRWFEVGRFVVACVFVLACLCAAVLGFSLLVVLAIRTISWGMGWGF